MESRFVLAPYDLGASHTGGAYPENSPLLPVEVCAVSLGRHLTEDEILGILRKGKVGGGMATRMNQAWKAISLRFDSSINIMRLAALRGIYQGVRFWKARASSPAATRTRLLLR